MATHMTVVISGSLAEVRNKMLRVKDRLDNISQNGFRRFMHDEVHQYHTADFDVCPVCTPFNGNYIRGDTLEYMFPDLKAVSTLYTRINFETVYHKAASCKCLAEWKNFEDCIINRICEAIIEA